MRTKTRHYRQGDVLIERVETIPSNAVKQKVAGRIILAHGEVTGHHHSIEVDDADPADWWKSADGSEQFVCLSKAGQVVHQEHGAVDLAPGNYRVRRQREYSPEAIRNVAD